MGRIMALLAACMVASVQRTAAGRKDDQVMKRIERLVVDECIDQTSALPGQLRSRLGDGPIQFVFLATEHPGIPDIEILDKRLDARSALLTQDRVLHNLVIGPGFPESGLTDRRLARVSAVDKYLPVSIGAPRSSYAHQSNPEAQAITQCVVGFLSEHQLKQFRTKRRRIRAHFGTLDNIAAAGLTIGQRRTSCGVLGGESGCPPRSEGSACGKRELFPRSIKLR